MQIEQSFELSIFFLIRFQLSNKTSGKFTMTDMKIKTSFSMCPKFSKNMMNSPVMELRSFGFDDTTEELLADVGAWAGIPRMSRPF